MTTGRVRMRLDHKQMVAVAARWLQSGWIVNLGSGIPMLTSSSFDATPGVALTSENGAIGYGIVAPEGQEDVDVVNASVQYVTLNAGGAILGHADSLALIRSGKVDCTVLGAYEVAVNESFAKRKTSNDGHRAPRYQGDNGSCRGREERPLGHGSHHALDGPIAEAVHAPAYGCRGTVRLVITSIRDSPSDGQRLRVDRAGVGMDGG